MQLALNLYTETPTMTPTQTVALTRAKAFLAACGLPYAIQLPDGSVEGILILAPQKTRKAKKRVNDFAGPTGYPDILDAMQPGDNHVFRVHDSAFALGLRNTISGGGSQRWGKGNVITAVTGLDVEILRVA